MKRLQLLIILALFFGCSGSHTPQYKIGDCLQYDYSNDFEVDFSYYKVLKIGKNDYLLEGQGGWPKVRDIHVLDITEKISKTDISKCWKDENEK